MPISNTPKFVTIALSVCALTFSATPVHAQSVSSFSTGASTGAIGVLSSGSLTGPAAVDVGPAGSVNDAARALYSLPRSFQANPAATLRALPLIVCLGFWPLIEPRQAELGSAKSTCGVAD